MICVWEFWSVDRTERVVKVIPAYEDDRQYEHEFQRILYRGPRSGWTGGAL
jgi:hypothetical protein